ncbi:hypothetical protein [Streptomyces sp. CS014]|uniref:hypothetical protein n=1 Tax=Streptomyces sp. CS014 TaxID=2162707 RepID=UPI0013A58500|nr:hypothetical protein [Streptomyces sp. CS014]
MTTSPSTASTPAPRSSRPARQFVAAHGEAHTWGPSTIDLYLDLYSTPSPKHTSGGRR